MAKSKVHHWWPVGLQNYWIDAAGSLHWVEPDGQTFQKKPKNSQVAKKRHGHTYLRGTQWEDNFEDLFRVDTDFPQTVETLLRVAALNTSTRMPEGKVSEDAICYLIKIDEKLNKKLTLLLLSLLVRSPSLRKRLEQIPTLIGMPASEDVGKMNMKQRFVLAQKLCQTPAANDNFFVVLHSEGGKFIYGDGFLDRLTCNLNLNLLRGHALVPLTPQTAIYVSNRGTANPMANCATLAAPEWMVAWVNEITQTYSCRQLFFRGEKPELSDSFSSGVFQEHDDGNDELIIRLNHLVEMATKTAR